MKNSFLLISILLVMLSGAFSVSAQDKDKDKGADKNCCHHGCHRGWWWRDCEFWHSDFHSYRAWKKDVKREKKECLAKEMEVCRPFAAERKRRKAMKKAWKRDIIAAYYEKWGHDYWY